MKRKAKPPEVGGGEKRWDVDVKWRVKRMRRLSIKLSSSTRDLLFSLNASESQHKSRKKYMR